MARPRSKKAKLAKFLSHAVEIDLAKLRHALARKPHTVDQVAELCKCSRGQASDALEALQKQAANIEEFDGLWSTWKTPPPAKTHKTVESDKKGWHRFGVISDTHYGSRFAREDAADALYEWYAEEGLDTVYHCGNWIEGEAHFNQRDLIDEAHGMQAQLDYFVERYPKRKGITTYYVAGDDHEGWYSQRERVDIGAMLANTARNAGRKDLVNLGYKEAFVTLEHVKSGKHARLLVDHPGGGSAYADSYAAQKRIEAAQPGEKPGMWLFGHWHKAGYFWPRGVHVILAGCTKDLDTFGRKKGLRYDVGGWIVEARQDEGGAIVECRPRFRAFYDRSYTNEQYSLKRKPLR